jgi:hypothetical protein
MRKLVLVLAAVFVFVIGAPAEVLPQLAGLVAYWPFDVDSVDLVVDASGNGLHGTSHGATLVDGVRGRARSFDGNDYIEVPDDSLLDITIQLTIMFWAKTNQTFATTGGIPICKRVAGGSMNYAVEFGEIRYPTWPAGSDSSGLYVTYGDIPTVGYCTHFEFHDNQWHHYAISLQFGNPRSAKIMIDGNVIPGFWMRDNGTPGGGTEVPTPNNYPLLLGGQLSTSPGYWIGQLDQVRIYSRSLSQEQIAAIYETESARSDTSSSVTVSTEELQRELCKLQRFYSNQKEVMDRERLLGWKTCGNDGFLAPNFLAVNLDLNSILHPDDYTERLWLVSLWTLAIEMTARSDKLDAFKQSSEYSQIIEAISQRTDDLERISTLASPAQSRDFIPLATQLGPVLRDILVKTGAFESNRATVNVAYSRLGGFVGGIGLALTGVDALNEKQKVELMTNSIVVWSYFEDFLLPQVKKTRLFQENQSLRTAITRYEITSQDLASQAFESAKMDLIMHGLVIDGSAFLIGLAAAPIYAEAGAVIGSALGLPGAVAGAVLAVAAGIVISFTADQMKEGGEFIVYNDISARLFTLALENDVPTKDGEVLLGSFSLFVASDLMKNRVLGKGIVQKLAFIIPMESEEKRWNRFLAQSFDPHVSWVNASLGVVTNAISQLSDANIDCTKERLGFLN